MRRLATITAIGLGLLLSATTTASAHVGVRPAEAPAGATRTFAFDVPHGCAGQATTSVALRVPPGFADVEPRPKSGWALAVEAEADGATTATWSGGSFPDGQVEIFRVRMTTPATADAVLYVPVVQECAEGRYRWIQIPTGNEAYEDLETPAPRIRLGAVAANGDADATAPMETSASATVSESEPEPEPLPELITGSESTDEIGTAEEVTPERADGVGGSAPSLLITALILAVATVSVVAGFLLARRRRS